ncbi:MAG: Holliday junction resolvase RuvX [Acholeplasmatales bacterium]|nr:Holliday junction resolvase RuvX [Acholeplasmatales bacterium]
MKYLGLDLGSRTLGVAISESGIIASNLETFRFREDDYDSAINHTKNLVNQYKIDCVVLGLPKHMNGDLGIRAQLSYDFKDKLISLCPNLEVVLSDERLTTVIVDKTMIAGNMRREKRKSLKDEMAAVVILQDYLDRK